MCHDCYEEFGSPKLDSPSIREAAKLIQALDEHHSTGGMAHIVTDDWNLEDPYIDMCLKEDPNDLDNGVYSIPVLKALRALTVQERASALYMARMESGENL